MLLAIDIGNTNIGLGIFNGRILLKGYSIATYKENSYQIQLKKIFNKYNISDCIVCSVVPKATKILEEYLKKLSARKLYIIGKNIKIPIKNLYRDPKQVGQDRLVNAYAGVKLFGAPLIMVDFGTAITFEVVTRRKEYLGGLILPGLCISLKALYERTALLPKIKLERPKELIGRTTKNSMLSGIVYGFAALTDDMCQRIREKIGKNAKVIGTGGNIDLIAKYCKRLDKIDKNLTLKGLYLLHNTYSKGRFLRRSRDVS